MANLQAPLSLPSVLVQIAALLAGPVIWVVYFLIVYAVAEFGCISGALNYTIGNLHIITLITAGLGLVAMIGLGAVGWGAYLRWRDLRPTDDESIEARRTRFISFGSILLAGLFELAILLNVVPVLVLQPCQM